MTDLIDRQALLAQLRKTRAECESGEKRDPGDTEWPVMSEDYDDVIKLVEAMPSALTMTIVRPVPIPPPPIDPPEPEEGETMWRNSYVCPECKHEWTDEWPAQCDDDCPKCGCRHISPTESEEIPVSCPACEGDGVGRYGPGACSFCDGGGTVPGDQVAAIKAAMETLPGRKPK